MMYRALTTLRAGFFPVFLLLGALIIVLSPIVEANTPQPPHHIGRIWHAPEYNGAEGWGSSSANYPAGITAERDPWTTTNSLKRGWVGQSRKRGTYLMTTDWTDPDGITHDFTSSYFFRSMNYDFPPTWLPGTEGDQFNYLYPGMVQCYNRWDRPVILVNGVEPVFHPGWEGVPAQLPNHGGDLQYPYDITDPNLVGERVIHMWWRYIQGLRLDRLQYAYAYGTPHQDYYIEDMVLVNDGIMGNNIPNYPGEPVPPAPLDNQTLTGVIWATAFDHRNAHAGGVRVGADNYSMYVRPFGSGGHAAVLFWDGDSDALGVPGAEPGPDYGDPPISEWYEGHLLGNAHVMQGPVFVSQGPGAAYGNSLPDQPAFRMLWAERGLDFAGQDYSPIDPEEMREMVADGGLQMDIGVDGRDDARVADFVTRATGITSLQGYGPLAGDLIYDNFTDHGWTLGPGESVRIVNVVAAGGLDREVARALGNNWVDRRENEVTPRQTPEEIELIMSGRDTAYKAMNMAYWNFHGQFPAHVDAAKLADWGIAGHAMSKPAGMGEFNVPDAPRPPANFAVYACAEGGIGLRWSREAEMTPNHDTGVNDFAGYRIYRQEGSRNAPWEVLYEGPWFWLLDATTDTIAPFDGIAWYDDTITPGEDYWYCVVAKNDGSQNWAQPGVALESTRWWTWTGYLEEGVFGDEPPPNRGEPPYRLVTTPVPIEIEGEITTQTWQSWRSPYRVTGTVTIPEGNTLTIDAGVDVLFDADVKFIVEGALRVRGTRSEGVRFLKGDADQWGGIRISGGDSSAFAYTRISDGNAWDGGGLSVTGAGTRVSMLHCTISGNTAEHGGGLYIDNGAVTLTNCTISENTASTNGGGLWNYGMVTLRNCTISGNTATVGGGLANNDGTLDLTNCTISGNTAVHGGGLFNEGLATLTNCTVFGNDAENNGGGLLNYYTATLTNCILWANTAPTGPQIHRQAETVTVAYSNVQDGIPADVTDGGGNIDADPLFRNAAAGDFRLTEGSPCIDAGDPASPPDPDGTPADMGAFWFPQGYLLELPTLSVGEHATFTLPITAVIESARGVNLAFTFNSAAIAPATPFIVSTAFDGAELANIQHNVRGDTVLIAMAAAEEVTLGGVLAELRFVAISEGSSPLLWLPDRVDADEELPHLVDGSVQVAMLYGDVSNDGTISAFDASMVLRYVVMLIDQINFAKADVSGNGKITAYDAALILHHVVNPSYVFPVEGGPLPKPATSPTLAWERADGAWVLRSDTPSLLGAELELRLADGVQVTSPSLLELSREGGVLRVAVASAGDGTEVLRVHSQTPPVVLRASVNEQDITIAQPVQFSLSQNAPNPFNPVTTLRFGIEIDGPAKLVVYDVNGRLVRTLVDGNLTAGHHEVVWDARDNVGRAVASGVYVYRLTSGENVAMRRMVLVR